MKHVESELTSFIRREAWVIDVYGLLHERPLSMKHVESELTSFIRRKAWVTEDRDRFPGP